MVTRHAKVTERVVCHLDLDCFYVQVERQRNPSLLHVPCAVVQYNKWQGGGIIALSYEAKSLGVKRSMRGDEASKKCPGIRLVTVPVAHEKADLTRYREAGTAVFELLSEQQGIVCERTSIDEAYLDITALATTLLPYLLTTTTTTAKNETPTDLWTGTHVVGMEHLQAVDWMHTLVAKDADTYGLPLSSLSSKSTSTPIKNNDLNSISNKYVSIEDNDNDTNDRLLLAGAIVAARLRQKIRATLGYTLSAGIAHNKMLAKHASGMNKPFQQTVVPKTAVPALMTGLKIGELNGFGGKKGIQLEEQHSIRFVADLQRFPLDQLQKIFGVSKFAQTTYDACRGICHETVKEKLLMDSVGNSKTFNPPLKCKTNVKKFVGLLAEEVFRRLETISTKYRRRALKITVSISRGKELVQRKGIEVSVAGGKNNVASKAGRMSKWEHGQLGLAKLAYDLVETLFGFATVQKEDGGVGVLKITSLGLIASELEAIPNQASMITGFLQKKGMKATNMNGNPLTAIQLASGKNDGGNCADTVFNTEPQVSTQKNNNLVTNKNTNLSQKKVAVTINRLSPHHDTNNNSIGVVDAKDVDLKVLLELPVDMRASIEKQIALQSRNNICLKNAPTINKAQPKRKRDGGKVSTVIEGGGHTSISSFLRPMTVKPFSTTKTTGGSNDTAALVVAVCTTPARSSRTVVDNETSGNNAADVMKLVASSDSSAMSTELEWICKNCTWVNPPIFLACKMCQSLKNC